MKVATRSILTSLIILAVFLVIVSTSCNPEPSYKTKYEALLREYSELEENASQIQMELDDLKYQYEMLEDENRYLKVQLLYPEY